MFILIRRMSCPIVTTNSTKLCHTIHRLRESLAQINGIELLTIKDTALQLVFTKKKGKEQAG